MKISLAEKVSSFEKIKQIEGARVGKITRIDTKGRVWVNFSGTPYKEIQACFTKSLTLNEFHEALKSQKDILLVFENADPSRPIIVDILISEIEDSEGPISVDLNIGKLKDFTIDGNRVTFDAKEQIVFKCGKASITLTNAGKVLIKGVYLSSRSSGANKIKGASIDLN